MRVDTGERRSGLPAAHISATENRALQGDRTREEPFFFPVVPWSHACTHAHRHGVVGDPSSGGRGGFHSFADGCLSAHLTRRRHVPKFSGHISLLPGADIGPCVLSGRRFVTRRGELQSLFRRETLAGFVAAERREREVWRNPRGNSETTCPEFLGQLVSPAGKGFVLAVGPADHAGRFWRSFCRRFWYSPPLRDVTCIQ